MPFYYGWVILAVGTVGMLASFPGQTAGVSVFTEPLREATTLSRLELATAYLLGTTSSGLLLPMGGRWIDRFGARVVAFGASVGLATTLTGLSLVGSMGSFTGLVVMTGAFACLRFFGQGLLTLSSRTMISRWFERRRGLVSAVSNSAFSFVFSATPALLLALIQLSDFRWAWRQLAIGLIVLAGGIILVFFRNDPRDCGLEIDGGSETERIKTRRTRKTSKRSGGVDAPSVDRAAALQDIRFWIILLPVAAMSVVGTALTFHIVDFGTEVGLDESTIVRIFIPIALVSIPVTLISGWLADTSPVIIVAAAMAVFQIAMYLSFAQLGDPSWRIVAIVAWGASSGCRVALTSAALPRLFGRDHLGAIAGTQMSMLVIGSAIGPALFAFIESALGSYQRALWISLIGPVASLALVVIYVLRRPALIS